MSGEDHIDYPEDIAQIKARLPYDSQYTDGEIQKLYREFSEDSYCAGWVTISSESIIDEFFYWLEVENER